MALTEFLTDVLLKDSKDTIAVYNVATGARFTKRATGVTGLEDLLLATEPQLGPAVGAHAGHPLSTAQAGSDL